VTASRPLVLLPGLSDAPAAWQQVTTAARNSFSVLTPDLPWPVPGKQTRSEKPMSLPDGAAAVLDSLDRAGIAATNVCGAGLGAMVALQLAADHPDRVEGLALITRQVPLSGLLMSLPAVVSRLLPATAVQRLGAGQDQLLALLDQVRPVDATPLARRVNTPALVLCGARDPINRRASESLAKSLPSGGMHLLPQAGPSWLDDHPQLLVEALRTFLAAPE